VFRFNSSTLWDAKSWWTRALGPRTAALTWKRADLVLGSSERSPSDFCAFVIDQRRMAINHLVTLVLGVTVGMPEFTLHHQESAKLVSPCLHDSLISRVASSPGTETPTD
jgi:hypothetical protein